VFYITLEQLQPDTGVIVSKFLTKYFLNWSTLRYS